MKQITADLKITGIDISIARLGATVTFLFLERYEAKAWYLRRSSGNQWLETNDKEVPSRIHDAITAEVEENEDDILTWVEEQFANKTDQVDPVKESYDILQLQKMGNGQLIAVAEDLGVAIISASCEKKQELIYAILEKQAKS